MVFPSLTNAARVASVTFCRTVAEPDLVPIDPATHFVTTAPEINAIVDLADVTGRTVLEGAWVAVNAISTPNYKIDAMELVMEAGQDRAHFSLSSPDNGWPPGDYSLEISLDGKLATIGTFTIGTGSAPGTPGQPRTHSPQPPAPAPPRQVPEAASPSGKYGYSGTYVVEGGGNRVTLVFREDAQGILTGSLTSTTGARFQIEGQVEEGAAVGICYNDEGGAFFEAYAEGDDLWFSLIDVDANNMPDYDSVQDFQLIRVQQNQVRENQATSRSTPRQGAAVSSPARQGSQSYRHPIGFSFRYPDSWSTQVQGEALQLIPPDAGSSPDGPTEIYAVAGQSVAGLGVSSPDDPQVLQYLDQEIRALSPFVTRQGGATPIPMQQGQGCVFTWEGKSPRGDVIYARAFVSIMNEYGLTLIAIGFKDLVQRRDSELRQIFATFGFGQGHNDPALVGNWRLVSVSSIDNQSPWESAWSPAQAVSEENSGLEFRPEGSWFRTDENHMIVGAGDVWLEDNDRATSQGSWNAGEGVLFMVWDDNSYEEYEYRLQGAQLRMVCEGKGEVWERAY